MQLEQSTVTRRKFPIALKLAASVTLLMLACIALVAVILLNQQSRIIRAHAYDFSTLITELLASSAVEPLFTEEQYELQAITKLVADNDRILGVAIFNRDGKLLASEAYVPPLDSFSFDKPFQEIDAATLKYTLPKAEANANVALHVEPVRFKGVVAGYVVASYSDAALERSFEHSLRLIIGTTALLMLACGAILHLLGRQLTRPIQAIVEATQDIDQGNFTQIHERRNDELGQLITAINGMGNGLIKKQQVEQVMGQFLARDIASQVIGHLDEIQVGGEQVHATVLFADIVGFTSISEQLSPIEISELLNEYFGHLSSCARFYFGNIDKFIGDCVMVVFGAPKDDPQHQYHAVACAVLMQRMMERLNTERARRGELTVELRIGINSGNMLAGLLGANDRLEYTVVGDSVNLASRLCNEAGAGQIIVEQQLHDILQVEHQLEVEEASRIKLRGKAQPVKIYNVTNVAQAHSFAIENLISDIIDGQAS